MPSPLLNRAALFAQRLLRDVHYAPGGSPAEDTAFTKLAIAYQVVFRKSLRGEAGWNSGAGRLAAMTSRLVRAESGDLTGPWEEMIQAQITRNEKESLTDKRRAATDEGSEMKKRIRRAQLQSGRALYGRAAKTLAQKNTLDPTSQTVRSKLKALHPAPATPVQAIPSIDLPPKPCVDPERVRVAIHAMDKESAAGPDRAGVRWLLLVADNQLRACPEFSGLKLLSLVVQKIVAGDFSTHVGHVL